MKNIILFFAIIFFLPEKLIFAQEVFIKGGIGFYNIYEENILTGREREIKLNPTPTLSAELDWDIGSNFFLGGEVGLRMKTGKVDYFGIDTATNSKAVYGYINLLNYNIDTKVLLKLQILKTSQISITPYFGSGISVKLYDDGKLNITDYSVVRIPPDGEMPPNIDAIINNSGLFVEGGIECRYKSVLISFQYLFEFFRYQIYNVGDIKTGLLQINVGYRF